MLKAGTREESSSDSLPFCFAACELCITAACFCSVKRRVIGHLTFFFTSLISYQHLGFVIFSFL